MSAEVDPTDTAKPQCIETPALQLGPDPDWQAEIMRRMQEIDAGAVQCRSWDEVMAELRAKHKG